MADEPDTPDPGQAFAALMSSAASAATPAGAEPWLNADGTAKYGTHPDGSPKKAAGRPRKPPSIDELKALRAETLTAETPQEPPADRAPASTRRKARKGGKDKPDAADDASVPYRPGQIGRGMERLYRRAGRIVKAMDRDIGIAIIESAEDCAEAWEELARVNPRVRRFLLKMIAGGAYGQLVMAHLPILMAVIMKEGIRKHIPFVKVLEAMAEPDEKASDEEKAEALNPADLGEMLNVANGLMARMGMGMPAAPAAGGRRAGPAPPGDG